MIHCHAASLVGSEPQTQDYVFSYQVCIRPESGACCVQYQVCSDQTNAFTLAGGGVKMAMSVLDENCPSSLNPAATLLALDYIEIVGKTTNITLAHIDLIVTFF